MPVTECGCWLWLNAVDRQGYGAASLRGKYERSNRAAWIAFNGDIPDGLHVLHRCDIPSCVNPDHLFLGTQAANMADKARKGRASSGESHNDAKLTVEKVKAIRASGETIAVLASRYGVGMTTVWKARNGVTWRGVAP